MTRFGWICLLAMVAILWLAAFAAGWTASERRFREPFSTCPTCNGIGIVSTKEAP